MKKNINKLNDQEVKLLEEHYDVLSFPNDFDLVYEKQIPNTGVALLDGEIELLKKLKKVETIQPGHLLGIQQLLDQEPVSLGCKVKKNSKIVLLGKSDILDALNDDNSKISPFIKKYDQKD